ncbi:unnamed protein product [Penicillium nalgiovense]|nr:unnamed protein product [Penicillium nalgiovense]
MNTSALTAANSQTFPLFPYLPPELRAMIWRAALPEKDSPAFTPYQGGSWSPSPVPATGVHFGEWKYRFDLDMICVKIPLASVNDEARDVAITWAHKQGIEVIFDEKRRCNFYIRRSDPMRDMISFGEGAFQFFARQCREMQMASGPNAIPVPIKIGRLAISETALTDRWFMRLLCDAMRSFCGDVVMFIITGKHPAFDVTFGDFEKAPPRWVLDATHQGESIVWDRTIERLEMRSGNQLLNDHSYERVIEVDHAVSDHLAAFTRGVNYFEIRAAHAIKL